MNTHEILKRAERDLKFSRYRKVIHLLEPKILLYSNDAHFYYLLGSACYFTNDIQGAQLYLYKGLTCAEDNIEIRLMLACVALRRRDTALALQLWIEVDDLDPDNKKARTGLTKLKLIKDNKDLSRFISKPSFSKLLPIKPLPWSIQIISTLTYGMLLLSLISFIIFLSIGILRKFIPKPLFTRDNIPEEFTFFTSPPALISDNHTLTLFTLTESEIMQAMHKAREYLNEFQDDLAGRELNRIIYSNASSAVKNQAVILMGVLKEASFASYSANFTFAEVASDPLLYQGLHVLWRGPINGLNTTSNRIAFRLLVGYDDGKILEGSVDVLVPFEIHLEPQLSTNVLGKVVADASGNFYLIAVSINQIIIPH